MSESVVIPADRDVRATLDRPDAGGCVVACPPHPRMGGSRHDSRLRAVSAALESACLRVEYGPWDGGPGELDDVRAAGDWARERYDRVALFGYSFGGCLALVAAARDSRAGHPPAAVAALAPAARIADGTDAVEAISAIDCPVGVVYGERDTTVDAERVADRVHECGGRVEVVSADHFFLGQTDAVAELLVPMLE